MNGSAFALALLILAAFTQAQVIPPNRNPVFDAGPSVRVDEDSGAYANPWATNIGDGEGPPGTITQSLTFVVTPNNPSLFSQQPAIDVNGVLQFTPAPNAFGSTEVTVHLEDDGTSQCIDNGSPPNCPGACTPADCSRSRTVTFVITIDPVNDCPVFQLRGDITVDEDSGQHRATGFAHDVSQGAPNEHTQQLTWTLTIVNGNPALFQQAPQMQWTINNPSTADLTFTPADNRFGQAEIEVIATDDGPGTGDNCRQSEPRRFTITVNPINDPPTFVPGPSPVTGTENQPYGPQGWATDISPGPFESDQTVRFNLQFVNPAHAALFAVEPAIDSNGRLTFTPAPHANTFGRNVEMHVQLQDSGGQSPRDLSCNPMNTCPRLQIIITPVNDPPTFTPGGDIVVYEDMMNEPIPPVPPIFMHGTAWATNIRVGPPNEGPGFGNENQQPVFVLTNTNPSLFDVQPRIDPQGTLFFQLRRDAFGIAEVEVQLTDTGTPPPQNLQTERFTITVLPVNDPPTFEIRHPNPIVLDENSGPRTIDIWAINAVVGPTNEWYNYVTREGQRLNPGFYVEPMDPNFFKTGPTIDESGGTARLQFEVADYKWGETRVRVILQDDGGVENYGRDTSEQWLHIIVNSINHPPSFSLVEDVVSVIENAQPSGHVRSGFAYNISAGGPREQAPSSSVLQDQSVRFVLTHNFHHIFSVLPTVDIMGTLRFTTARDEFGTATVTIYAEDNFLPPAVSTARTFEIRVLPRNNPPTFTLQGDIVGRMISQCSSPATCTKRFAQFATDIFPGPVNERDTQLVTFSLSVQPRFADLFEALPTLDPVTGDLDFELKPHRHTEVGNPVVVTVVARDNGGTANGGIDTTTKSFKLEVQRVENPPSFTPGPDQDTDEDSPTRTIPAWATNILRGPIDDRTEGLRFDIRVSNPELFALQPRLDLDIGNTATLSYRPAADRFGMSFATVTLINDNNNRFSEQFTFVITINPINDAPTFTAGPEVLLMEGSGFHQFQWATDLNPGPFEERQILSFTVTCTEPAQSVFKEPPTIDDRGVMRLTLEEGRHGAIPCTALLMDNGGLPGVDRTSKTFTIRVQMRIEAPSFTKGPDITMLENNDPQVRENFVRNIDSGARDGNQQLEFVFEPSDASAFEVPLRIDPTTGRLTFTLTRFYNGVQMVRYFLRNTGVDGSNDGGAPSRSITENFQLVVRSVNDPPEFMAGPNVVVLENSGVSRFPRWATEISPGPPNEAHQTLRFTVTPRGSSGSLFALPPAISPLTGDLMFSTASDRSGSATLDICLIDNGGTENGGVDRLCKEMTVAITAVNRPPTAVFDSVVTVLEDAGPQRIANFLRDVSPGGGNEHTTQLIMSIAATIPSTQSSAFRTPPRIALDTYELTFETAKDFFGKVEVTVSIKDDGGTSNGGVDTLTRTFTIDVLPVNDAPSFTVGSPITLREGAPPYSAPFATEIRPGPPNENDQKVTMHVRSSRPEVFTVEPRINAAGFLSFTLHPDANGVVDLIIHARDDGGTDNGGVDRSEDKTVRLTITPVNDPPTFKPGPSITLLQDAPPHIHRAWATEILAGPEDEVLTQTVHFELTPADTSFFSVQPKIEVPSGDLSFTLAPNRFGTTTVEVMLFDDGPHGFDGHVNRSPPRTLTIQVTWVNNPPVFRTTGDVTVLEDAGDVVIRDWITDAHPGEFEDDQNVFFTVSVASQRMFSSPPRVVGKDLVFSTAPDANGVTKLTLNASDRAGNANGGREWTAETFELTIVPVNDPPVFVPGGDISVEEGSHETVVREWLVSVVPGPPDESHQTVTPFMTVNRSDILTGPPTLNVNDRSLTFRVQPHAFGTVVVRLWFRDNGGTENGGNDTSAAKYFRIIVTPVNDPPTFTPGPLVVMTSNTAGSYSQPWATNISPGPREEHQTVGFIVTPSNPLKFTTSGQPTVSPSGTMSFSVAPGAIGNVTLSIVAKDSEGAKSATTFVTVLIGNANARDTISLTLNMNAASFNSDMFRQVIAANLGIAPARVVVRNVESHQAGTRVDFVILAAENTEATSDEHTRQFMERALTPGSSLSSQLNIVAATVVSAPLGAPAPPGGAVPGAGGGGDGDDNGSGVNWIALGVGLFVGFAAIALIVGLVIAYRRSKKRDNDKRVAKHSGGYPPNATDITPPRSVEVYESPQSRSRYRPPTATAAAAARGTGGYQANPIPRSFVPKNSPRRPAEPFDDEAEDFHDDPWHPRKQQQWGVATPPRHESVVTRAAPHWRDPDYQNHW